MRSILAPSFIVVAGALAAAGCTSPLQAPFEPGASSTPSRGGQLRVASFAPVRSLDPAVSFDEGAEPLERLLFARLFFIGRDRQLAGDLAESFDLGNAGTSVTVRLRPGIWMHDGQLLDAGDVKRSLQRALSPSTPCPAPSFFQSLKGYDDFHSGKTTELRGIVVHAPLVVSFELEQPDATFAQALTLSISAPVCRSEQDRFTPDFGSHPCGAGPYRLDSWDTRGSIRLVRHEGYGGGRNSYLDSIVWTFGLPPQAQRFAFEQGGLDFVHELSAADSVMFRSDPRWTAYGAWTESRAIHGLFMNTELAPFNNVLVRQAVSAAIDRSVLGTLRAGHIVPANKVVPSGVGGFDQTSSGQQYDLGKALGLMRQAGFGYDPSADRGGYPDTIDYVVPSDSFDSHVAQVFQQQLRRIGIRIRIHTVPWGDYLALTSRRGRVAMGADGWNADFDDPSNFFEPLFSTKSIQDEGSQNRAFFSSTVLDELLGKARSSRDQAGRAALYHQAEQLVQQQAPWAIAYGFRYYEVWQPYVKGYSPHPAAVQDFSGVWIDRPAHAKTAAARPAPFSMRGLLALLTRGGAT